MGASMTVLKGRVRRCGRTMTGNPRPALLDIALWAIFEVCEKGEKRELHCGLNKLYAGVGDPWTYGRRTWGSSFLRRR
jgi:hypothetical protein